MLLTPLFLLLAALLGLETVQTTIDQLGRTKMSVYEGSLATKKEATKPTPKRILFTFEEVQVWQRDNEYLVGHYRNTSDSYRECLKSLFYLHNQTGNIFTHLIGAVMILLYAIYAYDNVSKQYMTADIHDLLAFGVFVGSAVICFGISATFHTFGNHSNAVYHTWLMLDLYGIFILIVGTVYSGTYYGFYCERQYWILYSAGVRRYDLILQNES